MTVSTTSGSDVRYLIEYQAVGKPGYWLPIVSPQGWFKGAAARQYFQDFLGVTDIEDAKAYFDLISKEVPHRKFRIVEVKNVSP